MKSLRHLRLVIAIALPLLALSVSSCRDGRGTGGTTGNKNVPSKDQPKSKSRHDTRFCGQDLHKDIAEIHCRLDLDGVDLAKLRKYKRLRRLFVRADSVTGLETLSMLRSLRDLTLTGRIEGKTRLDSKSLRSLTIYRLTKESHKLRLGKLPDLRKLTILSYRRADLSVLARLPSLSSLSFESFSARLLGLDKLVQLTSLWIRFTLADGKPPVNVIDLKKLQKLRQLEVTGYHVPRLSGLNHLPALRILRLKSNDDTDLDQIATLSSLVELRLRITKLAYNKRVLSLVGLTKLKHLELHRSFGYLQFNLAGLTGLTSLSVRSRSLVGGLRSVSSSQGLQKLRVSLHNAKAAAEIGLFRRLNDLEVHGNLASKDALGWPFKSLKRLHLVSSYPELGFLGRAVNLRELVLELHGLTALSQVPKLTGLQKLSVRGGKARKPANLLDGKLLVDRMPNLRMLKLNVSELKNCDALRKLGALRSLELFTDQVDVLRCVASYRQLTQLALRVRGEKLSQLSDLSGLTALKHLGLKGKGLTESTLRKLPVTLTHLELLASVSRDFSWVARLGGLQKFVFYHKEVIVRTAKSLKLSGFHCTHVPQPTPELLSRRQLYLDWSGNGFVECRKHKPGQL